MLASFFFQFLFPSFRSEAMSQPQRRSGDAGAGRSTPQEDLVIDLSDVSSSSSDDEAAEEAPRRRSPSKRRKTSTWETFSVETTELYTFQA